LSFEDYHIYIEQSEDKKNVRVTLEFGSKNMAEMFLAGLLWIAELYNVTIK
jgi:hypothetical protein